MVERKEPGLDPDALENLSVEPAGRVGNVPQAEPVRAGANRGSSLLLTLILLLLAGGGGYLGYQLVQQQSLIEDLNRQLAGTQARVESLEATLEVTTDSAAQSGQTLQQRLQDLDTRLKERSAHYDSEVAKLWTIAHQRNKPQLEQQGEKLKTLEQRLLEAEKALQSTNTQTARLGQELAALSGLKAEQASLSKSLRARLDSLGKQLGTLESSLKQESEGRLRVQKELTEQLAGLQGGSGQTAELAQRIRQNEQAIKAIDGTRRQLSQDLLRIRQQLNNLQLRIEQG